MIHLNFKFVRLIKFTTDRVPANLMLCINVFL